MASIRERVGETATRFDGNHWDSTRGPPDGKFPDELPLENGKTRTLLRKPVRRIFLVSFCTLCLFTVNEQMYGKISTQNFYKSTPLRIQGRLFQDPRKGASSQLSASSRSLRCRQSFLDTFGTICAPDDMWDRILAVDAVTWSQIRSMATSNYVRPLAATGRSHIEEPNRGVDVQRIERTQASYSHSVWAPTLSW